MLDRIQELEISKQTTSVTTHHADQPEINEQYDRDSEKNSSLLETCKDNQDKRDHRELEAHLNRVLPGASDIPAKQPAYERGEGRKSTNEDDVIKYLIVLQTVCFHGSEIRTI